VLVLEALLRRLPSREGSEFASYQKYVRIRPDAQISDFALLAYTEAKLPNDGFSIVDPLGDDFERCERLMEVAGYRHQAKDRTALSVGSEVSFRFQPENQFDVNAVQVTHEGGCIGYINRLQASEFKRWIAGRRLDAVIDRLNGASDRPTAYLCIRVSPAAAAA
jgi:hypothetical protein